MPIENPEYFDLSQQIAEVEAKLKARKEEIRKIQNTEIAALSPGVETNARYSAILNKATEDLIKAEKEAKEEIRGLNAIAKFAPTDAATNAMLDEIGKKITPKELKDYEEEK